MAKDVHISPTVMTAFSDYDYQFMTRAINLAKKGLYTTSPNPSVGCVLVKANKIIGQGFHQKAGQGHAEVNAIADAKSKARAGDKNLFKGVTAYVTLEPCSHFGRTPPCAQGLINAGVSHVIVAMVDPNPKVSGRGLAMLEKAGITTQYGLLESDAKALNLGFIKRMQTALPYVRCKLAASLDGKTAMASGESKWITSSESRRDVQVIRAQSCAIITGADSVITDNAKLNVRWNELGELKKVYAKQSIRQPLRVVIDSQHRITPDLALFSESSPILIISTFSETAVESIHQWPHFVEHVQINAVKQGLNTGKVDLSLLLALLAEKGINQVLIESGARLAGAFIEQNLVDELILYQAPKLLGGDGKNLIEMPSIQSLLSAKELAISDMSRLGCDIKITARLKQ